MCCYIAENRAIVLKRHWREGLSDDQIFENALQSSDRRALALSSKDIQNLRVVYASNSYRRHANDAESIRQWVRFTDRGGARPAIES